MSAPDDLVETAPSGLEQMQALKDSGRGPPFNEKLKLRLVAIGEGYAEFEADPNRNHYNPMKTVHGGFIATILDSACGVAVHTTIASGQSYTTLELKVSFLRPLGEASGTVRAVGRVASAGSRVAFAEATLVDGAGRLCATATSTLLIFEARP